MKPKPPSNLPNPTVKTSAKPQQSVKFPQKKQNGETSKSKKEKLKDDLSVLMKSVNTSIETLQEIIELFENATPEVIGIVTNECSIILECKICKNLFRSLANFMTHKRGFCLGKFEQLFQNHEHADHVWYAKCRANKVLGSRTTSRKDIMALIDSMKKAGCEHEAPATTVLKNIDSTNEAFFNIRYDSQNPIKENERIVTIDPEEAPECVENEVECTPIDSSQCTYCRKEFSSLKALSDHVKKDHAKTRMSFVCPCCKKCFANSWSVYRHMYKVHRKTNEQVRKLRGQILKKQVPIEEIERTGKGLIISPSGEGDQEKAFMEDLKGHGSLQRCSECGKRFDRKVALIAHSSRCHKKSNIPPDLARSLKRKALNPLKAGIEKKRKLNTEDMLRKLKDLNARVVLTKATIPPAITLKKESTHESVSEDEIKDLVEVYQGKKESPLCAKSAEELLNKIHMEVNDLESVSIIDSDEDEKRSTKEERSNRNSVSDDGECCVLDVDCDYEEEVNSGNENYEDFDAEERCSNEDVVVVSDEDESQVDDDPEACEEEEENDIMEVDEDSSSLDQEDGEKEYHNSPIEVDHEKEYHNSPIEVDHEKEYSNSPIEVDHEKEYSNSPIEVDHEKEYSNSPIEVDQEKEYSNSPIEVDQENIETQEIGPDENSIILLDENVISNIQENDSSENTSKDDRSAFSKELDSFNSGTFDISIRNGFEIEEQKDNSSFEEELCEEVIITEKTNTSYSDERTDNSSEKENSDSECFMGFSDIEESSSNLSRHHISIINNRNKVLLKEFKKLPITRRNIMNDNDCVPKTFVPFNHVTKESISNVEFDESSIPLRYDLEDDNYVVAKEIVLFNDSDGVCISNMSNSEVLADSLKDPFEPSDSDQDMKGKRYFSRLNGNSPRPHSPSSIDHEDDGDLTPDGSDWVSKKIHSLMNGPKKKCLLCFKTFHKAVFVRRHIASHYNINKFKCLVNSCNYQSYLRTDMNIHLTKVHKKKELDNFVGRIYPRKEDFDDRFYNPDPRLIYPIYNKFSDSYEKMNMIEVSEKEEGYANSIIIDDESLDGLNICAEMEIPCVDDDTPNILRYDLDEDDDNELSSLHDEGSGQIKTLMMGAIFGNKLGDSSDDNSLTTV